MSHPFFPARLEAALWEKTFGLRRYLRAMLGRFSRRRKRRLGATLPEPIEIGAITLPWPLVEGQATIPDGGAVLTAPGEPPSGAPFVVFAAGSGEGIPAEAVEAMVLVAAAENLDLLVAGWAEPSPTPGSTPAEIRPFNGGPLWLARSATAEPASQTQKAPWLAKVVPLLGPADSDRATVNDLAWPFFEKAGPYRFPCHDTPEVRTFTARTDLRLAAMPTLDGPPAVLFLLPFLAVGGAERLLFDLLSARLDIRALIVTVEPHLASLGQTVSRMRTLTPHIYTLGDWLPRETHFGVLAHLLRRYRVETLVSWNGTTFFYDHAPELRRNFPQLRILAQLYHHEGGYFARTGPAIRAALSGHLAVNPAIVLALTRDLGVPAEKVHLLHHGVELPAPLSPEDLAAERQRLRQELGLPNDALVVGSFLRLHPQKRPFDILELARRLESRSVYFLLVGGGPLEAAIDAELAQRPLPNLRRLPLLPDARPLYAAIELCLLTSAYEGLPVFLLDGLARGIPCVSTAVGEVPELLAEGGGRCAPVGDLQGLAAAIEVFFDAETRHNEGARGRSTIEKHFSLEIYANAYRDVLLPSKDNDERS